MKIATTIVMIWMLAAGPASGPLHAQNNNELFEKALVKERAEGDLAGAIKLYQQIVNKKPADRALLAKTLVQLAQCYEKQGLREAHTLYDRVVREFSDQRTPADVARERIAALDQRSGPSKGIVLRQVWSPAIDTWGSPSADGRLLSFVDWETGDLAVRDLASGQNRRLMNHGSWEKREFEAEGNKISPDGRQIVYMWNKFRSMNGMELRLINSDGTGDRLLYRHKDGAYTEPYNWSPDGKSVAAEVLSENRLRTYQMILISVADGAVKVLQTVQNRRPSRAFFSPDGRWLAYSAPANANSGRWGSRDMYLLDLQSSDIAEIPLVTHPSDDLLMGWTPDGKHILFRSDRGGSVGAWLLPMRDGKAAGDPFQVKRDFGDGEPIGFTRDGAFFYSLKQRVSEAVLASLDSATGKLSGKPESVSNRYGRETVGAAWSPDGSRLLYTAKQVQGIIVRTLASGAETVVHPRASLGSVMWHPDGNGLLGEGLSVDGKTAGIFRIDIATGEPKLLVPRMPGWTIGAFAASRDGKTVYYKTDHQTLTARNVESGDERVLYRAKEGDGAIMNIVLSPDDRTLAVLHYGRLQLVPVDGGPHTERLAQNSIQKRMMAVDWTPDGRSLVLINGSELWRLPVKEGDPQVTPLDSKVQYGMSIRVHPDGKRIAFTTLTRQSEVWALEGFLPQVARR